MGVEQSVSDAPAEGLDEFSSIYRAFYAEILRYVHSKVGDWSLAEDLTSETFLRAFRHSEKAVQNPAPWLTTVARNLLCDHFRSARFRYEVLSDAPHGSHHSERSAEESFLQKEDAVMLLHAMTHLPDQQQSIVRHRFYEGLNVRETAERVNRCTEAVRSEQFRALRKLGRLLEDGSLTR